MYYYSDLISNYTPDFELWHCFEEKQVYTQDLEKKL